MIRKFSVKNFRNFRDTLVLDFTHVHDYQYNENCVKNGLINKVIVYGKNSVGKSNLSRAVCDIFYTIFSRFPIMSETYKNADAGEEELIEFNYSFLFNNNVIDYSYRKTDSSTVVYEKFSLNDELIFEYDSLKEDYNFSNVSKINAGDLNWEEFKNIIAPKEDILDEDIEKLSALRYIIHNTIQNEQSVIYKLTRFLRGMRFFYTSPKLSIDNAQSIKKRIDEKSLNAFQNFLNDHGVDCKLTLLEQPDGKKEIFFDHKEPLPFFETISSGTAELTRFFFRNFYNSKPTFIFLDEFDAYYHFELSEKIVRLLEKEFDCQVVLTTHNTNLLSNSIMRPDCFMILDHGKLTPICETTTRELRQGHNLEKLYINGEFDE